jgi:hypothetical protein
MTKSDDGKIFITGRMTTVVVRSELTYFAVSQRAIFYFTHACVSLLPFRLDFPTLARPCMHVMKRDMHSMQSEEKKASEKELLDFLNKAPIAMHWLSGTGHVLWANETEMNVLGYTPEEYIGQVMLACFSFPPSVFPMSICHVHTRFFMTKKNANHALTQVQASLALLYVTHAVKNVRQGGMEVVIICWPVYSSRTRCSDLLAGFWRRLSHIHTHAQALHPDLPHDVHVSCLFVPYPRRETASCLRCSTPSRQISRPHN